VRTVVDAIAREVADLESPKMYEKIPRSADLPSDRVEIPDHDMAALLCEPDPTTDPYIFWFSVAADIEIYDRAILLKVRSGTEGPPDALVRIPPSNLMPHRDQPWGPIIYWQDAQGKRYDPKNLMVFWGYDPQQNHASISSMETLRLLLSDEDEAQRTHRAMWAQSLRKDGVIQQHVDSSKMSDPARQSFLIDVADSLAGTAGTGFPLMLEPGMQWVDSSWSPKEMEYIGARKLNRVEVAAAFHVSPNFVAADGPPDQDALNHFYRTGLPPRLRRIESTVRSQLLPDFIMSRNLRKLYYVEFNLDRKLRGSFEEQMAILATSAGGPIVTVNEARARLNLPPIEGGDLIFVPLNSIRAGGPQGAPGAPVQTPATPAGNIEPTGTTPGGGSTQQTSASAADKDVYIMGLKAPQVVEALLSPDATSVEELVRDFDAKRASSDRVNSQLAFVREQRVRYELLANDAMLKFLKRQKEALSDGDGFKTMRRSRWDKELADEIFGVMYLAATTTGEGVSSGLGWEFSDGLPMTVIKNFSDELAKSFNNTTEIDPANAFEDGRALSLATQISTAAIGWAVSEVADQAVERGKDAASTWHTTSKDAHQEMDGRTVTAGLSFKSGLAYPGDPLSNEEATCTCVITVSCE
jgi:HK97 family phage portal protein